MAVVHRLRETASAGSVRLCRIACSDDSWKTRPDGTISAFASSWHSDVTCPDCLHHAKPWQPWKRMGSGEVRNFGTVHLIP